MTQICSVGGSRGNTEGMASRDSLAPLYGALMMIAAVLAATGVTYWSTPPSVVRTIVVILAIVVGLWGAVLTLHDRYPTRRR